MVVIVQVISHIDSLYYFEPNCECELNANLIAAEVDVGNDVARTVIDALGSVALSRLC